MADLHYSWETSSLGNPQYFKAAASKPAQPLPHRGILSFYFYQKTNLPSAPGDDTISIFQNCLLHKHSSNAILDKSCHKCVETPWRIASQQVFSSLPLDPLSKGPKQRYSTLKSFIFSISRYFSKFLLDPHFTLFHSVPALGGWLTSPFYLHMCSVNERQHQIREWEVKREYFFPICSLLGHGVDVFQGAAGLTATFFNRT